MKKFLMIATLSLLAFSAQANEGRAAWICGLNFHGESRGVQLLLGSFKTVATGELNCADGVGGVYKSPVRISMQSRFLAPTVGVGMFKMAGLATEISLLNSHPSVLFGNYLVAQGEVALVGGVGAFTAVRVSPPQIALNVSVQLLSGFGLEAGIQRMKIEPLN